MQTVFIQKCMEDTESLQESWEQEHNQTLEKHEDNANSLAS